MPEKQGNLSPLSSFGSYVNNRVRGRVRYPRGRKDRLIDTRWGKCHVLKEIEVKSPDNKPPGAIFMVRFHLKSMSPRLNTIFLNLPVPFYAGLPGFRAKLWLFNEATGDFQGLYQWDTVADARAYAGSFAAQFMKGRSVPGSVEYAIVDRATGVEVAHGSL